MHVTLVQSMESPIFDASFWSENEESCSRRRERNKIGDSVLCSCHHACVCMVVNQVGASRVLFASDPRFPNITEFPHCKFTLKHVGNFRKWRAVSKNTRLATSPRNPRFPIYRLCIQTTFPARMSISKSGISGSACDRLL